MAMAFTTALYYPWIDIKHEGWLKNALLYWNEIHTIVPESIDTPYTTKTAKEAYEEELLKPLYVESRMQVINELTDDVLKYLESPEGTEVLMARDIRDHQLIHLDKLPSEIQELVDIHPDKLPHAVKSKLRSRLSGSSQDWIAVDSRFASFYMTLLATRLSENSGLGLLTDMAANSKLANAAKLDASLRLPSRRRTMNDYDDYQRTQNISPSLAQGMLSDLIFERIKIDPDTPFKKILDFRRRHKDELGRFRVEVAELTKNISGDQSLKRLRQEVNDTFINKVTPSIDALKEALTSNNIKWVTENFLKVSFFSTSSTSLPLVLLGLSVPQALLVGVGISLTASAILYNREKAEQLRKNPYSCFLAAEKAF
jgi:hypothetical protein